MCGGIGRAPSPGANTGCRRVARAELRNNVRCLGMRSYGQRRSVQRRPQCLGDLERITWDTRLRYYVGMAGSHALSRRRSCLTKHPELGRSLASGSRLGRLGRLGGFRCAVMCEGVAKRLCRRSYRQQMLVELGDTLRCQCHEGLAALRRSGGMWSGDRDVARASKSKRARGSRQRRASAGSPRVGAGRRGARQGRGPRELSWAAAAGFWIRISPRPALSVPS